jgi:hypothetical protein
MLRPGLLLERRSKRVIAAMLVTFSSCVPPESLSLCLARHGAVAQRRPNPSSTPPSTIPEC